MAETKLEEQEQKFLDYLFDTGTMRDPNEAKVLAGYDKDYPVLKLARKIKKELIEKYDDFLALYAVHGIKALMDILQDPTALGAQLKLKTVIELLDRSGVVKKEKSEVTNVAPPSIKIYLPSKLPVDDETNENK